MATLSACLIVKNESEVIKRCIESIYPCVDEIVVYDTGSNDGTQDICKSFEKVKLIQGYWDMDFARARNESFANGTMDYLMWVDADDVLEDDSIEWIKTAKDNNFDGYDGVYINYVTNLDDEGNPLFYYERMRIVKRTANPKWIGEIHETLSHKGSVTHIPLDKVRFIHKPHKKENPKRNFEIFQNIEQKKDGNLSPREWFYYARESEWYDTQENTIKRYMNAVNSENLWRIDRLNAYLALSKIYSKTNKLKAYEYAYMAAGILSTPRCDVCCRLGDLYLEDKNYKMAKVWYDLAIDNVTDGLDNTFCNKKYSTSYPRIQLCIAEYWLGNIERSIELNEEYGKMLPNNKAYLFNKKFFEDLNKQKK